MPRKCLAFVCLLTFVLVLGCTTEEPIYDMTGTVTYDNQPIPKGLIFFDPDPAKGGGGPQGFANIEKGQFSTAKQGKGIRGGAYFIRINGYDGVEAPEAPFGQFLFPEYQESRELPKAPSELTINIEKKKKK